MTKNQVIERLFLSDNFCSCIAKMEPDHLREDLKAEVILIICEMDEEKLLGLHHRKELEFYTVRIILNLIKSDTSPFAKAYRKTHSELREMQDHPILEINEIVERAEREQTEDIVLDEIERIKNDDGTFLYWYNAELMRLYIKHGNFRALQTETGIPYISCYKNIKQSFEEIRNRTKVKAI